MPWQKPVTTAVTHITQWWAEKKSEAVEYAAYARILVCHACQLAVGAVEGVGPDQQEHAEQVHPEIVEIEAYAGAEPQEDGGYGDGVGGDVQFFGQHGPGEPYRAVEDEVEPFLGVARFQCVAVLLAQGWFTAHLFLYFFISARIAFAIQGAASARQGAKLGQSLKSMMRTEPSASTMASPP